MGITGLLPLVKPIIRKRTIKYYKGKRIGVDGSVWLHTIASIVAFELYHNIQTKLHLQQFKRKLEILLKNNIIPVFVFDGDFSIAKEPTTLKRKEIREKYRLEVENAIARGDEKTARKLMERCVNITPEFMYTVLEMLSSNNIEYIIAPYEADPQLVYLQKIGYVDYILTIDSDLIIYGSEKILFKFDGRYVDEYDKNKLLKLDGGEFLSRKLLDICILSGCDFLPSIRGIGLKTAIKILKEVHTIEAFVKYCELKNKIVPEDYLVLFAKAKSFFLFNIVYDPVKECRVNLNELEEELEFLGTKENLKFKINDNLTINRHFKPLKYNKEKNVIKTNPIKFNKDKYNF